MNKNNLPIYFSLAVILGILIGTFFNGNSISSFTLSKNATNELKIKRLINFIQRDYVDTVNTDKLLDGAITQMLGKLDPHSVYIPKENLQAVTESMQGNFVGIGVQFRMIKDSITVIQPIKGGPSIKSGILAGDRILAADKDTLFGKEMQSQLVPKYLKGKPNTKVALQIYRKTNDSLFTVNINRGKVNIKSVDLAYMLNDSVGYIKLDRFARNTYKEFKVGLDELLKKGNILVPLNTWSANQQSLSGIAKLGVWMPGDTCLEKVTNEMTQLPIIGIDFPAFIHIACLLSANRHTRVPTFGLSICKLIPDNRHFAMSKAKTTLKISKSARSGLIGKAKADYS